MASEQRHRCEECGGELTCCGPMTEDGPLLDCLLCQRSEIITKLKAQLAARDQQAGNVLARIHRDGGHYITQHGWEKACVDADAVVCRLQAQLAASEAKRKVLAEGLAREYCAWREHKGISIPSTLDYAIRKACEYTAATNALEGT